MYWSLLLSTFATIAASSPALNSQTSLKAEFACPDKDSQTATNVYGETYNVQCSTVDDSTEVLERITVPSSPSRGGRIISNANCVDLCSAWNLDHTVPKCVSATLHLGKTNLCILKGSIGNFSRQDDAHRLVLVGRPAPFPDGAEVSTSTAFPLSSSSKGTVNSTARSLSSTSMVGVSSTVSSLSSSSSPAVMSLPAAFFHLWSPPRFEISGIASPNSSIMASSCAAASSDTPESFLANQTYLSIASSARIPVNYTLAFANIQASTSGEGYLGYSVNAGYDTLACANLCTRITSCEGFNIYIQRDPLQEPNKVCSNPSSVARYLCTLWDYKINSDGPFNYGNVEEKFRVVFAAGNGYIKI